MIDEDATVHRVIREAQEIRRRGFDAIDAFRAGKLTSMQLNKIAKTMAAETKLLRRALTMR